jgi:hypothetical protein
MTDVDRRLAAAEVGVVEPPEVTVSNKLLQAGTGWSHDWRTTAVPLNWAENRSTRPRKGGRATL